MGAASDDDEGEDAPWINFWSEAGRARLREIEAAIMAADVPKEERLAALERFRASIRNAARSPRDPDSN